MKEFDKFHPIMVRLPVKRGKEEKARRWLAELKGRADENRESMKIEGIEAEAVFSSTYQGTMYLSWFLLKREMETPIIGETHLDRQHHEFLMECIDFEENSERETLEYSIAINSGSDKSPSRNLN